VKVQGVQCLTSNWSRRSAPQPEKHGRIIWRRAAQLWC